MQAAAHDERQCSETVTEAALAITVVVVVAFAMDVARISIRGLQAASTLHTRIWTLFCMELWTMKVIHKLLRPLPFTPPGYAHSSRPSSHGRECKSNSIQPCDTLLPFCPGAGRSRSCFSEMHSLAMVRNWVGLDGPRTSKCWGFLQSFRRGRTSEWTCGQSEFLSPQSVIFRFGSAFVDRAGKGDDNDDDRVCSLSAIEGAKSRRQRPIMMMMRKCRYRRKLLLFCRISPQ